MVPCHSARPSRAADVPGTVPDTTPALASRRVHRRGSTLTTTFRELGILPETAEALEAVGIITPFPIQEMTLPVALSGSDVIGQAKTGTGKTLGFGLPLLERVTVPADVEAGRAQPEQLTDAPQALVVVPTRELCTQVTNDLLTAGKVRNVRVLAIYGGRAYEPQVEALKKGVDVIVGTPGRLLDLAGQKKLNLKHIKALVLDEADEMLDLGFLPDVEKIMNMLPARRQTMLFSATMPGAVIGLARRYMSQPTHIRATAPDDEGATVRNTAQFIYRAHNMDKPELVARILQADGRGLAMVFCRTKRTAADLADQLQQRGFASGAVHGDLGQGAREQALRAFRNGKVDVLVCTDVAARGIDVEGVTHVINYQSPEDEKTYLHRIGRTGRAGAKGIAITLVDWDDIPRWQLINKALDLGFGNPPETYSTSPHLFEELNIPAGTKGVLPRSERTRAGLAAEEVEDLGETGGRGGPRGRGGRSSAPAPVERERERPARTPRRRRRTRNGAALEETSTTPTPQATTEPAAAETTEPRTPRRRRRTRAGGTEETVAAAATVSEPSVSETPQAAQTAVDTAEGVVEATPEDAVAKQRRRRTRKTAEAAPAPVETVAVVAESAPVVEAVTEAVVEAVAEAPAKPVRRRTRKAAEAVVDTAEGVVEAAPEAPATKPRRTRAKATAEAPAEAAVDSAEATAKPVRRRTRKAVAETVATVEVVAPVEAEIPAQTAAVEAVAEAPAKPVRRRTRKVAEAAEVAVDTAEGVAEAPVAKPRRTRKAAVAVVDAAEAAPEAPATKPRRTRAKATTEAPAEAAVDSAEATAKPVRRRTRKAVAEPVEAAIPAQSAAVDEPEAKPRRRARKVVEPAVATEAAPEAAAPRRRTRKAAAAAEPAES
ncbi:DEAD/DEAH box helicase [Streptomyces sp. RLA2-12]|nr:DEAD/DEAH box helicase [Streptomyces sp. RLA2-12]QDN59912.1 DEAD/DEAH box helicase [Streptomyces sp. S1D4-20]QDN69989.1 DEAD/DEAH box helicase [Streptomyces sp. S1D4-14]QDO52460.1 DEAD/DEAH box helicase [Streptomyces sp. RLB3-5]QDO62702.1 DEAD/DEAH box helicase [Streptomyces sp. RLB1-8]